MGRLVQNVITSTTLGQRPRRDDRPFPELAVAFLFEPDLERCGALPSSMSRSWFLGTEDALPIRLSLTLALVGSVMILSSPDAG